VAASSKFVVKKDKVILKLGKVKGEYSYDSWSSLTAKKGKKDTASKKADPQNSIMELMKDMYDNGDDQMKKTIGESMMKSHRGEKTESPKMPGMDDFGMDDFGDE
jgi:calcyclin binding protein